MGNESKIADKRPKVDLRTIDIISLDLFLQNSIEKLKLDVAPFFGTPRENVATFNSTRIQRYVWDNVDRNNFFDQICNNQSQQGFNFSPETLRDSIETVSLSGSLIDWLPFFILEIHATVKPEFLQNAVPEEFGGILSQVSHPIRLYLESLGGMISSLDTSVPKLPMITWVGSYVEEKVMEGLISDYESLRDRQVPKAQFFSSAPQVTSTEDPKFPYVLEAMGIIENRSAFNLATNVVLLFGNSYQVAFNGQRTIYCNALSTDVKLLKKDIMIDAFGFLPPPANSYTLFFNGISIIASVIALNGWLQFTGKEFTYLEINTNSWRTKFSNPDITPGITDLNQLSDLGLKASSMVFDLNLLKRMFSTGLESWRADNLFQFGEIAIVGQGTLNYIANDTLQTLDRLLNNAMAVRDDVNWIMKNISIKTDINTNENLTVLNEKTTKYTRWVTILTVVLTALTTFLVFKAYVIP